MAIINSKEKEKAIDWFLKQRVTCGGESVSVMEYVSGNIDRNRIPLTVDSFGWYLSKYLKEAS
jgi:hypothetical protein